MATHPEFDHTRLRRYKQSQDLHMVNYIMAFLMLTSEIPNVYVQDFLKMRFKLVGNWVVTSLNLADQGIKHVVRHEIVEKRFLELVWNRSVLR